MSERRGLMFILSSPSGAGKTTLSRMLLASEVEAGNAMTLSISVTTRKARPGEVDGKDYCFIDKPKFDSMAGAHELLEHAEVFGNFYGTPASFVENHISKGTDVLFDIDWQGTRQLAEKRRVDMVSVFILPPSMAELERRLRARAQDSDEIVKGRMSKAAAEISHYHEYDYVLVNNNLDESLATIRQILVAERLKRSRQLWLKTFVDGLA
jgi:guanylate kinase